MWALDVPVRDGFWNLQGVLDRRLSSWPDGVTSVDISSSNIEHLHNMPRLHELHLNHTKVTRLAIPKGLRTLSCSGTRLKSLNLPHGLTFVDVEDCTALESLYVPDTVETLILDGSGVFEVSLPAGLKVLSANRTTLPFLSLPVDLEEFHARGCGPCQLDDLPLNLRRLSIDSVDPARLHAWIIPRQAHVDIGGCVYREPVPWSPVRQGREDE